MPKVALIMGSKSDWPSLRGCVDVLKGFEIEVEVHVASAHRTPEAVAAFAANARENGFEAIIAAAGKAAYLAAQMLSIKYPILAEKLLAHRERMAAAIEADDKQIQEEL